MIKKIINILIIILLSTASFSLAEINLDGVDDFLNLDAAVSAIDVVIRVRRRYLTIRMPVPAMIGVLYF
jgi:hypothetical protein